MSQYKWAPQQNKAKIAGSFSRIDLRYPERMDVILKSKLVEYYRATCSYYISLSSDSSAITCNNIVGNNEHTSNKMIAYNIELTKSNLLPPSISQISYKLPDETLQLDLTYFSIFSQSGNASILIHQRKHIRVDDCTMMIFTTKR